jgi:hypothetical protein
MLPEQPGVFRHSHDYTGRPCLDAVLRLSRIVVSRWPETGTALV